LALNNNHSLPIKLKYWGGVLESVLGLRHVLRPS
jgi:hypothetical protein